MNEKEIQRLVREARNCKDVFRLNKIAAAFHGLSQWQLEAWVHGLIRDIEKQAAAQVRA